MAGESGDSSASGGGESNEPGPSEDASIAALQAASSEAHRTLDEQLATLDDIDSRAVQLLQFTVALLGLVVSVLSFVGSDAAVGSNPYLGGGVVLLLAGSIVAGVTYTVSARVAGIGPRDLERSTTAESEVAFRQRLVRSYADWIRFNSFVNARAAFLITVTVLLVVAGAIGLALGVLRIVLGSLPIAVPAMAALVFVVAVYGTGVHRQVYRLRAAQRPERGVGVGLPTPDGEDGAEGSAEIALFGDVDEYFTGQRCFKGDSRESDD